MILATTSTAIQVKEIVRLHLRQCRRPRGYSQWRSRWTRGLTRHPEAPELRSTAVVWRVPPCRCDTAAHDHPSPGDNGDRKSEAIKTAGEPEAGTLFAHCRSHGSSCRIAGQAGPVNGPRNPVGQAVENPMDFTCPTGLCSFHLGQCPHRRSYSQSRLRTSSCAWLGGHPARTRANTPRAAHRHLARSLTVILREAPPLPNGSRGFILGELARSPGPPGRIRRSGSRPRCGPAPSRSRPGRGRR
jgi:hypothetical protein